MKKLVFIILFLFVLSSFKAQIIYSKDDSLLFYSLTKKISNTKQTINNLVIEFGLSVIGKPYKGGTLDISENEQLIVNLREYDCVTFVENMMAFAITLKKRNINFNCFCNELKRIRYRNGVINNYTSRLHYFTDWIYDNQQKGIIENITKAIGGESYNKKVCFMSSNISSYPMLKHNHTNVELIKSIEHKLNYREQFYIPKNKIHLSKQKIKSGHIIAMTTTIAGLDITHVGFAYWYKNELHFLHASYQLKKIMITDESLIDYLNKNKILSGIMVCEIK